MTKIAIQPNASGTGTFTIAAPNSNDNRTFTLPDATGEVLTDQSNIEAQVKTAANASGSAPIYACRAWVNFDGTTTTPTIRASGNVSSVTKNSTGNYAVNFTTAMPDANYAALINASSGGATNADTYSNPITYSTASVQVVTLTSGTNDTYADRSLISIAVAR